MPGWGRWDRWARSGQWGGGGEGLVWLLYDEFTTDDAAPVTSPRTCEPGPGTLTAFQPSDQLGIVGSKLTSADVAEYSGIVENLIIKTSGHAICAKIDSFTTGDNTLILGMNNDSTPTAAPGSFSVHMREGIVYRVGNNSLTVTINETYSYPMHPMIVFRSTSTTCGGHIIVNGVLVWVFKDSVAFNVPVLVNHATVYEADNYGRLSLPANGYTAWDADFSTVTDSKTNPASDTSFVHNADCHIRWTATVENGQYFYVYARQADASNFLRFQVLDTRVPRMSSVVGGSYNTFYVGSALTDGVSYQFDVVLLGSSVKWYIDGVLVADVTEPGLTSNAAGSVVHNLVTNDIVLSTHPYPSLGIATDRVIAPQVNDTADCESDCLIYLRNITLATAGNGHLIRFRTQDATNYLVFQATPAGQTYLWKVEDGSGIALINVAAATSDGDDVCVVADGADAEIFVNGVSIGSTAGAIFADQTGALVEGLATGGTVDSIEFFPRDVSSLLPEDLV